MVKRKLAPVLAEIRDAIENIEAAIAGKSFNDYVVDWLLRRGVERGIEIISEAARHIPDDLTASHPEIPWKQVRGVGNLLRHEYHTVADRLIWSVASDHLSPLKAAIIDLQSRHC